jgi:hypothetical protein
MTAKSNALNVLRRHGVSETPVMLGGHPEPACTIPLPVRREDQHRVDEKYAEHGRGSLDQRMGTDWNQQEE